MRSSPGIILAAYGTPGIIALEHLFAMGIPAQSISILTHRADERNEGLHAMTRASNIRVCAGVADAEETYRWAQNEKADVLFSLHYRERIPGKLLRLFPLGAVNLHPSLLPKYRGCFSIPWALINGEQVTGFTYHYMTEKFDAGNIVLQKEIPIEESDTAFSLFHREIIEGLNVFPAVFKKVVVDKNLGVPQAGAGSYYSRQLPFEGKIDLTWPDERIRRFIRGLYFPPHTGAMVEIEGTLREVNSWQEFQSVMEHVKS